MTVHIRMLGALSGLLLVATAAGAAGGAAGGDPVVDAFEARCVAENLYRMAPADLAAACACMAPVLVSFLAPEARRQIEAAIRSGQPVALGANPFDGDPADLARRAIRRCPAVGAAMYRQTCAGDEAAPHCQEMRRLLDQDP